MTSDKLSMVRKCPCDDCCKVLLCRSQMLACKRFVRFQRHGIIDKRLEREPSRTGYQQLLNDD